VLMNRWIPGSMRWWAGPGPEGPPGYFLPPWLFLRAIGVIYFSAFYSLVFQIRGLLGPHGLLPVGPYLTEISGGVGMLRYWYAPTLLWLSSSSPMLLFLCWAGMIASLLLVLNIWPRAMLGICFVAFLSFVTAAQDFSGYQSDGMLLCGGLLSIFLAPSGLRPGFGEAQPPSRAPRFLLLFLWFTIYFESGIAKYLGGDPEWRQLTAMDDYYQNGPLPTWLGWYAQQLPHRFHAATAFSTLFIELLLVWLVFLPRRFRILCFLIVTPFEIGIILSANYAFLNYLVLSLGILLLDDGFLLRFLPKGWAPPVRRNLESIDAAKSSTEQNASKDGLLFRKILSSLELWFRGIFLAWVGYAMLFLLLHECFGPLPLPAGPIVCLEPFRVANQYGLFGRMTRFRYEIEFQGSFDDKNWIAYPFRYKPQDPSEPPGIYAPYQPRFDWNLWFASLGNWQGNPFVVHTEQQLLLNNPDVLALFKSNPFSGQPPKQVRAILWQYWFTDMATKRQSGYWWRREMLGLYAPTLEREPDGRIIALEWPNQSFPPP
jgi:lipase maturation factor 1